MPAARKEDDPKPLETLSRILPIRGDSFLMFPHCAAASVERESLLTEVWGYDSEAMSRTVDTHVRRLRSKLGPAAARWLTTVRGVGYRIRDPRAS